MRTRVIASIVLIVALAPKLFAATPVANWEFENNYVDSVNGYNLAVRAGASVPFVPGISGTAVEFNSPTPPVDALDALSQPNPQIFNSGMSIMGCILQNQNSVPDGTGSDGAIVAQSGIRTQTDDRGWTVDMSNQGRLELSLRDEQDDRNIGYSAVNIAPNVWTQFAITWDGSPIDGFKFYLNGALVPSTNDLGGGTFSGFPNLTIPMFLGATPPGYATPHGFVGLMEDISVFTGVLTAAEVQAAYLECIPEPGSFGMLAVGVCASFARRRGRTKAVASDAIHSN
jgi:hypothetical protein